MIEVHVATERASHSLSSALDTHGHAYPNTGAAEHKATHWDRLENIRKNYSGFPVFAYSLYFMFFNIHLRKLVVLELLASSSPDIWGGVLSFFPFTAISFLTETWSNEINMFEWKILVKKWEFKIIQIPHLPLPHKMQPYPCLIKNSGIYFF